MTFLHAECLTLLHHDLLKALVCGQRMPYGALKSLFTNYNMLHLFVVSGVHVYFLENLLKRSKLSTFYIGILLWIYGYTCNFSAPILRVLVERFLKHVEFKLLLYIPKLQKLFLSFLVCLPFSIYKNEFLSLSLSFYFSVTISSTFGWSNKMKTLFIFTLAHPIFIYGLGVPSAYSFFLLFASGPLVGFLLLPLSFASLLSEVVQRWTIKLCWFLENLLIYIDIFLNHPHSGLTAEYINLDFVLFHALTLVTVLILGNVIWKRKTLF